MVKVGDEFISTYYLGNATRIVTRVTSRSVFYTHIDNNKITRNCDMFMSDFLKHSIIINKTENYTIF